MSDCECVMKLESYWLDTASTFRSAARGNVGGEVDVVVIGGGFTGLSAALSLAKRGATVTLFESGRVVGEASGRNGGQCNNGTLQDYVTLMDSIGVERAKAYYLTFNEAVNTVETIVNEEAIACGFERSGKLKLAAKAKHFEKMALTYEVLRDGVDPNVELVPRERIREEINSEQFYGGLLQSTSAQLHVGEFGVGLAEACVKQGVNVYPFTAVTDVKRRTGNWQVTTPKGRINASQILLATGGGPGAGPFGWFRRRIVPVGSFIVVTEPLAQQQLDTLFPTRRSYVTSKNIGNYFRTTTDNRLLFGGRARFAMSNPRSDIKCGHILKNSLAAMFPELRDVRIDYCWGGSVDMSADRLPRAGSHNGLFYSMGYSGHGVQMAVHMGQVMAEVMAGNNSANPWRDLNWPAIPGHFGKPWFLPFVGAYYRVVDYLY